jgi:hypothetical protein
MAGVARIAGCGFWSRILNNKLDGVYSANIQGADRHMFIDRGG